MHPDFCGIMEACMNPSRNNAFQHALNGAAHPVALTAVSLLLVNALVLQPHWPSWFTGKIGDAAWLVLAPLLVAAVLAGLIPARWRGQTQCVGWLAAILCGGALVLVKTVPAANAGAAGLFRAGLGFPLKLALDPTDGLMLPALGIFGWVWTRPPAKRGRPVAPGLAALGLAALALMADAAAPQNLGITCLRETDTMLLAFRQRVFNGEFGGDRNEVTVYGSQDGGLTWQTVKSEYYDAQKPPTPAPDKSNAPLLEFANCAPHTGDWQLSDPVQAEVLYAFLSGRGIYRSDDAGQTLRKEADLPDAVLDAHFLAATGDLVVAAGRGGILRRTSDGHWQSVNPDSSATP
jgi:hypothetical protein